MILYLTVGHGRRACSCVVSCPDHGRGRLGTRLVLAWPAGAGPRYASRVAAVSAENFSTIYTSLELSYKHPRTQNQSPTSLRPTNMGKKFYVWSRAVFAAMGGFTFGFDIG